MQMGIAEFILLLVGLAALTLVVLAMLVRAVRWSKKGSPGATFIGWALLLLSAGINPQPPPQEQVEDANRQKKIKKDAEAGNDK